jgi:hypothetical protein
VLALLLNMVLAGLLVLEALLGHGLLLEMAFVTHFLFRLPILLDLTCREATRP